MHKILNPNVIGVSGRQSEVIELALNNGFKHLEIDILEFQRRSEQQGLPAAKRLLDSAKLIVAGFELPIPLGAAEPAYQASLAAFDKIGPIAQQLGATLCWTHLEPASDERPFHENFELHRKRLQEVGGLLDRFNLRLGVGILAAAAHRVPKAFQFIYQPDQLLLLLKTVGAANVGVLLDLWDWHVGGATLDQIRKLTAEQVVCVRIADIPADADLSTVGEEQRLIPGEASPIDAVAVVQHLAERKYEGPISACPHPSRFVGQRREAIVKKLSSSIDELWKSAGLDTNGQLAAETTQA